MLLTLSFKTSAYVQTKCIHDLEDLIFCVKKGAIEYF